MTSTHTYLDPYPIDTCPRCGATLDTADDNLDRYCPKCGITVKAATVTWEITEAE